MVVEHPVVKGIEGFPEIGHIGIYPARKARHVQRPCTPIPPGDFRVWHVTDEPLRPFFVRS